MDSMKKPSVARLDLWLIYSSLIVGLPLSLLSMGLIWTHEMSNEWQWTLTLLVLVLLVWLPWFLHQRLMGSLRSISNAILSLKDGDYSVSLEVEQHHGILQLVADGLNGLTEQLYLSRTDAAETHELLKKVMRQIDVVVMTFNTEQQLMRINDKGLQVLRRTREQVIGHSAQSLGIADCFAGASERTQVFEEIDSQLVWQLRRSDFREKGKTHSLVTLADLTAVLRHQELIAWQRMMRVLRHEISNSLAPVQSYAQTISWLIEQQPLPDNWLSETREGLEVIVGRTKALNHLMSQHKELTDLPKPQFEVLLLESLLSEAIKLERRCPIELRSDLSLADISVEVDSGQFNQLLLNLLQNAYEAMSNNENPKILITVKIQSLPEQSPIINLYIDDSGPGLASFDNLFVPFYTTKPQGSGIGLALCRQIATVHNGSLHLTNLEKGGCRATLSLPCVRKQS